MKSPRLTDSQIGSLVQSELDAALSYRGTLSEKRAQLMRYYNAEPYGDEVDGQSIAVTTDVADVVESMLPSLLRIFTQGKNIAVFESDLEEFDDEANQKTLIANYIFLKENNGVLILHDMFKDALLQFTGVVKVFWDDSEDTKTTKYCGMSELEYRKLLNTPNVRVEEVTQQESELGLVYDANVVKVAKASGVKCVNIPPEEFLVSKSARTFEDPIFIGHRSPKTRSKLVQMGFDKTVVDSLPSDDYYEKSEEKNARYNDYDNWQDANPGSHSPNDIIYLGEYYYRVDVDGDGIAELWQVMYAGNQVLSKELVDEHPFAVCIPIPIPHRAIGTCPAEQAADLQFRKSTLVRQLLNNVYQANYPRILHSNQVDLDDLLTPRAGGAVGVDTDVADVGGHAQILQVTPMIQGILQAIEYTDTERETRTGQTRYSQGLNAEALNKTATGFLGIQEAGQLRLDLIARIFADGGVKTIFKKIIKLTGKYQNDAKSIRVSGEPMNINPKQWSDNTQCRIDVGLGSGDRQEKIMNLNAILQRQLEFKQMGLVLTDQTKMYNTLDKLITEVGLKDVDSYFNNPSVPRETLFAENQQLAETVRQLQAQVQQNPFAEAELIKAQAKLAEAQGKDSRESRQFVLKMAQEDTEFRATLAKDLTELELKYGTDVPGAVV